MPSRPRRHLALLALLLLAFGLRVHALGAQSLWYDEAVTAQVAQQGLGELARWTADDIQPPLYYAVVAGWTRLVSTGEWALRLPSAASGLAMVALAYVLGRRLFGRPAAWIAAFLAAIHPLWVYYSQEARMYTLLTALGMLAGYALLRVLSAPMRRDSTRRRLSWWIVFAAACIAMLYTHYFAAFLLLAFAIFFLVIVATPLVYRGPVRRQETRRVLLEGALVGLVIVVAYLPWLPNALRRFGVDVSYWQGTLKLDEAIRHIAISFTTGETVLEQQAIPLAWGLVALAGVCWVALVWAAGSGERTEDRGQRSEVGGQSPQADPQRPPHNSAIPHSRIPAIPHSRIPAIPHSRIPAIPQFRIPAILFITLTLLVPIVGILLLSYRTPKFNPRYLMLASPALVLLWAGGLSLPFSRDPGTAISHPLVARTMRVLAAIALAAVSGIFLFADRNWFADPAFTKDDWRGAVAAVRSQLQPDEAVILVSGHALPAWRYYAPDVEPVRLPELEILDVNAVLDLAQAAPLLERELAGKQGAWLVQWQDDVVDPTGAVPYLLRAAGTEQPGTSSFWGLRAQHYRWPAGTSFQSLADSYGQAVNANFGNQVELVGFGQPPCDRPDCPLTLFWRALAPLQADYKLTATLVDPALPDARGGPVDRRLAAYEYPTFRWQPGRIVISQLPLNANQGTPPGHYRLRVGVYDAATGEALDVLDSAGAAQGRWAWLEPVTVTQAVVDGPIPAAPPLGANPSTNHRLEPSAPVQITAGVDLGGFVELVGITVGGDTDETRPGVTVPVTVTWRAIQPMDTTYTGFVHLLDAAGRLVAQDDQVPLEGQYPTTSWLSGEMIEDRYDVQLPANLPSGSYTFEIGLYDANRPGLPRLEAADGRDSILLGRVTVVDN